MSIIIRRIAVFALLILLSLFVACANQQSATPESSGANTNAANASATANSSASPIADLEPVMPEKVQVAFEQNCKNCHGPEGHGITGVGTDLRKAARRSPAEWTKYLQDEAGAHSSKRMPAMASLTEKDYEEISAYLADLTQNNAPAAGTKK